ncbi:hypothetical protein KAJ27_18620 [bacterium]|nr:hypothetical protein [bacterium]
MIILSSKRGFGLVIVILMSLIVGILSISFLTISKESNFMDINVHEKIQGKDLVESAISYLKTELDDDLNYPVIKERLPDMVEKTIILDISGDNSGSLTLNSTILKTSDTKHLANFTKLYQKNREFLKWGGKNFYLKVLKCWTESFEQYNVVNDFESNYSKEKKGYFVIQATGMVDEHEITLTARKKFSIFNSKIPVLSHYTLFVREHHNQSDNYNPFKKCTYFQNKDDIWKESNNLGLVLQNYQFDDRTKPYKWGWVYLGKGDQYNSSGGDSASKPNPGIIHIDATNGELGGISYKTDSDGNIRGANSISTMSDMFQLMTPRLYELVDLGTIPAGATWSGDVPAYGNPVKTHIKTTEGFYGFLKKVYDAAIQSNPAELFGFLNVGIMSQGDFFNSLVSGFSENPVNLGFLFDSKTYGATPDAAKFEELSDYVVNFIQKAYTMTISDFDDYYNSGVHLFGQFAWNGDKPFNTPTFIFGNVYSRFIQYGIFANIVPGSTQYTFAVNVLKGILAKRNGIPDEVAGTSQEMFFVVCFPDKKTTQPVVMGFNLPVIESIFFKIVKKIIGSFLMKILGKDKILKMAIDVLEGASPQQSLSNNSNTATMTSPVTGQPLTQLEITGMNNSVSGLSSTSALDINMMYGVAKDHGFNVFKVYNSIGWSQLNAMPYVEIVNNIYSNNKKYDTFKSKIVMEPYNKNFLTLFEQNWWEWQSDIFSLIPKILAVLGTDYILEETGQEYNDAIDYVFVEEDADLETDKNEVKVDKNANLFDLDFIKWVDIRVTHKIISNAVTPSANWKYLVRFLSPVGQNNPDSPNDFSLNKVVKINGDINIGDGDNPVGIKHGGMLIVYGDIYIKNSIVKNSPEEVLYLVAKYDPVAQRGGNIYIETSGKVEAVLVAYDGLVTGSEKVNIKGMICCKNLNIGPTGMNSMKKGGFIRFDPALRKNNYRVVISPNYETWNEK